MAIDKIDNMEQKRPRLCLHLSGLHFDAKKYKMFFGMFVIFPIKKNVFKIRIWVYCLQKEKTDTKAREAGNVFSRLKMGSLCHVVGTKAFWGEFRDHT